MAIILGNKPVIETKAFNDFALGLTVPIRISGYESLNYTVLNQAKANLMNLFSTIKGERVQQPNFGTDLYSLVFDIEDNSLDGKIQDIISREVTTWVPDVEISQINVTMSDAQKDNNTVGISLSFMLKNTQQTAEVQFSIQQ
jgi:phage baseplate assembly protein W